MNARPLMAHIAAETADVLLAAEVLNESKCRELAHFMHSLSERPYMDLETAGFAESVSRLLLGTQRVLDERMRSERRAYRAERRQRANGITVECDERPTPAELSQENLDALAVESAEAILDEFA